MTHDRRSAYGTLIYGLLLMVWAGLIATLLLTFHPAASDWNIYYDTARALRIEPRANLIDFSTTAIGGRQTGACPVWLGVGYLYPPLFAMLITPFTLLSCASSTLLWRLISLVLWAGCSVALVTSPWSARLPVGPARVAWRLFAFTLMALSLPLIDGMLLGQVHLLILAIVLGGVALVQRKREMWAGGLFAAGAWIKYVPVAVAGYYALTGRWKLALSAVAGGVALLIAQLVVVGPASLLDGFRPIQIISPGAGGAAWAGLPGGPLWAGAVGVTFVAAVIIARWLSPLGADDALGVGWSLCTVMFMSPIIQWLYLTWLLPAFWVCFVEILRLGWTTGRPGAWSARVALLALLVLYVLTEIPFNHLAASVAIVSLWMLCGALYLRRSGIRFITLRRQRVSAFATANSGTS